MLKTNSLTSFDKTTKVPKEDLVPKSVTEKLVGDEIRKLDENAEEIRKLKEQMEKKVDGR